MPWLPRPEDSWSTSRPEPTPCAVGLHARGLGHKVGEHPTVLERLHQSVDGHYAPPPEHLPTVNLKGADARVGRLSTPLFLHPGDDAVVAPDVTGFRFLRDRIREIRGAELAPF